MVDVGEFYDGLAREYDRSYLGAQYQREDRIVARLMAQHLPTRSAILDLGCGTGKGIELLPSFESYLGIDISRGMLERAQAKYPRYAFQMADAQDLPFEAGSFDAVVSTYGSLSHAESVAKCISEAARVVKPGGVVFLMFYGQHRHWRPWSASARRHAYRVRESSGGATPAWLVSKRAIQHMGSGHLTSRSIRGLTLAGKLFAHAPPSGARDRMDEVLSRTLVDLCQSIVYIAEK